MTGACTANGRGSILWLASYPKSGSTWLRALLTNYCDPADEPASINALIGGRIANDRHTFDELLGLDSSDLTSDEILRLRPLFHELLADELPRPSFVKTHCAYLRTDNGAALFPQPATAGAVYLVRNPLDVAVSLAHHENRCVRWAVKRLNDDATVLGRQSRHLSLTIPDPLLSWSAHVSSWLDQSHVDVHVLRYEDLHTDPLHALAGVLRFTGIALDARRLRDSVNRSAFARLRDQELAVGFDEKQPSAQSFFRAGVVGDWRARLSMPQSQALVTAHRHVMARLGYVEALPAELRRENAR